jgi:hypothetical protein
MVTALSEKDVIVSEIKGDKVDDINKFVMTLDQHGWVMIGFNNINYDYPIVDKICELQRSGVKDAQVLLNAARHLNKEIIHDGEQRQKWWHQQLTTQCDIFKILHLDNKNRRCSLKKLQFNMRQDRIDEMSADKNIWDAPVKDEDIPRIIEYCKHDVLSTMNIAKLCDSQIDMRKQLIEGKGLMGAYYWSDATIGERIVINEFDKLGLKDTLFEYSREHGRKPRRTLREDGFKVTDLLLIDYKFTQPDATKTFEKYRGSRFLIDIKHDQEELILNMVDENGAKFSHEFVLNDNHHRNIEFAFGKGGIHGSGNWEHYTADNDLIRDVDVEGMYPTIALAWNLKPLHLPDHFHDVYGSLPKTRSLYAKNTPFNKAYKNGSNCVYGKSKSWHSPFCDPFYSMQTTINGQLFLLLLWDMFVSRINKIEFIQLNTDGLTYKIPKSMLNKAMDIEDEWTELIKFKLESAEYSSIWMRDVNNYVAQSIDGSLKLKGSAYNFHELYPYAKEGMVAWHKDHSFIALKKAAVNTLVHGGDVRSYLMSDECNLLDFAGCTNVGRKNELHVISNDLLNWNPRVDGEIDWRNGSIIEQNTSRYYVTKSGNMLKQFAPSYGKKKEPRWTSIKSDCLCTIDNNSSKISSKDQLDMDWYVNRTEKLIEGFRS